MAAIINGVLRCPNPFGTVEPPAWWLRDMLLFDDKLVIFPSQQRGTMILARRATRTKGESPHDVRGVTQNPDTLLMAENRLVRVCEILPGTIWDQRIFQKLAAVDIRRNGGATEMANRLDAYDAKTRDTIERDQTSALDAINRDAYKGYKHRLGERISLANPHGRGTVKTQPISVHVRKPSPPAQGLVLAST